MGTGPDGESLVRWTATAGASGEREREREWVWR
jgi:hypothetical protein